VVVVLLLLLLRAGSGGVRWRFVRREPQLLAAAVLRHVVELLRGHVLCMVVQQEVAVAVGLGAAPRPGAVPSSRGGRHGSRDREGDHARARLGLAAGDREHLRSLRP
jgi:hypothetical protein